MKKPLPVSSSSSSAGRYEASFEFFEAWRKQRASYSVVHETLLLPSLLPLVAPQAKQRILDVGCGDGLFLTALGHNNHELFGLEINPWLAKQAKSRVPEANILTQDLTQRWPGELHALDAIVCNNVVMYLDDPGLHKLMLQSAEALRVGGRFVLTMTHPAWAERHYRLEEVRHGLSVRPASESQVRVYEYYRSNEDMRRIIEARGFVQRHQEQVVLSEVAGLTPTYASRIGQPVLMVFVFERLP